jgi:hypothetical protein
MSASASNRSRAMGLLPDTQPCRLVCRALNKPTTSPRFKRLGVRFLISEAALGVLARAWIWESLSTALGQEE